MKNLVLAVISVFGFLLGTMTAQAKDASLAQYRWKNRVLVVIAAAANDRDLIAQRLMYQQASSGMAERDVLLVEAAGDDERARAIRTQLAVGGNGFRTVLVGKDGNAAFSSGKPVTATELFQRIDAMPMRRDEMRRGK